MQFEEAIKSLCKFGLSPNEAKAYLTVVSHGALEAKEISLIADIPYSKIYSILNNLARKGWVEKIFQNKTLIFKPKSPREAITNAKNNILSELEEVSNNLISSLQPTFESRYNAEKPDVWIIRGKKNIHKKIVDMIRYTKKELLLALHLELEDVVALITALQKRGIRVKVLTTYSLMNKYKMVNNVRVLSRMFGGGIISDTREALIILMLSGSDIVGIWSNHIELINLARHYFESLWRNAESPMLNR